LLVAPHFGFKAGGDLVPGGLAAFGRCVARALASSTRIERLGLWSQLDPSAVEGLVRRMAACHAHPNLELDVRLCGGSRLALSAAVWTNCRQRHYDRVMYLLVNQAVLSLLPSHPPYALWEIGREIFSPVAWAKRRALRAARPLLSISRNTARVAAASNAPLPEAQVIYPCLEPPLFAPEPAVDRIAEEPYLPPARRRAVLVVGNMYRDLMYKGHRELIAAWPEVVAACPQAELWIVGGGDGRPILEALAQAAPEVAARQIRFLGQLDEPALQERFRRCRAFAMPSAGEGFGLVYLEAARHGVPCIAGKHDAAREIVLDGETGLLVEQEPHAVARACLQLLADDDLAARLGEAGRRRYLQNFRFQHFRQRLHSALDLA
jgi:phosphatidylinositol alpha-1,6-mannosyltransferase